MFSVKVFFALLSTAALSIGAANAYAGDATWFEVGLGACGAWSVDSDHVVALSTELYNNGAHCWQHIGVYHNGNYVDATIVDECEGCAEYDIDLSPSAFSVLAPQSEGRIAVTWNYE